jgi:hypothetical protein
MGVTLFLFIAPDKKRMKFTAILLAAAILICGCMGSTDQVAPSSTLAPTVTNQIPSSTVTDTLPTTTSAPTTLAPSEDTTLSTLCGVGGGQMNYFEGPDGPGYCFYPDGTVCKDSELLNMACKMGDCPRKCQNIGTRSEGWFDCHGTRIRFENCAGETAFKTTC